MNILHVTSGISLSSGGPTRSVKGLCRALATNGVAVSLLVLRGEDAFENPCGVRVIRGLSNCPALSCFDVVHIHGLWNWQLHKIMKSCQESHVPYIVSPRGMLDPWALSVKKWKKSLAMFLYQRRDLKKASAFHVTAELEGQNVRRAGFAQEYITSPNGVDLPQQMPERMTGRGGRTAIFLSRLHPGKGLLILAEAWKHVMPTNWRMLVVGPDTYGHKRDVVQCLRRLGIEENWSFIDMVDDVTKWQFLRSADLLVHPSVSENFGITIAEGLAAGLPVICTDGTPWSEIAEHKCGWYVKANSVDALVIALREATNSAELTEMGARGRKLVEDQYTWSAVCDKMVRGYEEVLNGRA